MSNGVILVEGSYLYFQGDVNYSQENFKLVEFSESSQFHIYAEVLSRVESGEFLKVLVRFEMNQFFIPQMVRVEKSIGSKFALESFRIDPHSQELLYTFQTSKAQQEFSRPLSTKHFLTSPAFSTATVFTQSKKFDRDGRTAIHFITSSNDWEYQRPPEEKIIFVESKAREVAYSSEGRELPAAHLMLFENDFGQATQDLPVDVFVSKHFGIPYELSQGPQRVSIKQMKRNFRP